MKVVSDSAVREHLFLLLKSPDSIFTLQKSFAGAICSYLENPHTVPPRTVHVSTTPHCDTTHLFMPCVAPETVGLKLVSGGPANSAKGLGFQGCVVVLDHETGATKGILDAKTITAFRTALASSLGLSKVFGKNVPMMPEITVFGVGLQAYWHIYLALTLYPQIERVNVVNRTLKNAEKLVSELEEPFSDRPLRFCCFLLEDNEVEERVRNSSVVFGCSPSTEPVIKASYINRDPSQRQFFSLIGSYKPHMIELDAKFVMEHCKSTKVLVDSPDHVFAEAGEVIQAQVDNSRLVPVASLWKGELVELGYVSEENVVVQKLVGLSIMDLAMAKIVLDAGVGTEVPF